MKFNLDLLEEYTCDALEFECPECGCTDLFMKTVYEDSDADGNRGRLAEYVTCKKCGYEE
jgi:predicted nucleic-acid-binding Zn-ribbon protein